MCASPTFRVQSVGGGQDAARGCGAGLRRHPRSGPLWPRGGRAAGPVPGPVRHPPGRRPLARHAPAVPRPRRARLRPPRPLPPARPALAGRTRVAGRRGDGRHDGRPEGCGLPAGPGGRLGDGVLRAGPRGCGGAGLRPIAMAMLQRLVELGGFQERQGHELFAAYLQLLQTHFHPDPGGAGPRAYGGELLGLTRAVFQPVGGSWQRAPTLEPVHLAQLLDYVCALAGAGLRLGSEVSQSLCVLFGFLLSVAPGYEGAALIRRQMVTDVCRKLVCTVGTESQAEVRSFPPACLVVCLCVSIGLACCHGCRTFR